MSGISYVKCEPLSAAWLKELREHNQTKRVCGTNITVEVYQFRDCVYSILANTPKNGFVWTHLIVGEEQAMVIDPICDRGDLKEIVNELTRGKPVVAVYTIPAEEQNERKCQFEKGYCHEYGAAGDQVSCLNHHTFWLAADHEVELIWLPGRHPGQCVYIDRKNRILFCGEALLSSGVVIDAFDKNMPYSSFSTVEAFYLELTELKKREDEFDSLFPGRFILDLAVTGIDGMAETCRKVLDDPVHCDFTETLEDGRVLSARYVKGLGALLYSKNSIYMNADEGE